MPKSFRNVSVAAVMSNSLMEPLRLRLSSANHVQVIMEKLNRSRIQLLTTRIPAVNLDDASSNGQTSRQRNLYAVSSARRR